MPVIKNKTRMYRKKGKPKDKHPLEHLSKLYLCELMDKKQAIVLEHLKKIKPLEAEVSELLDRCTGKDLEIKIAMETTQKLQKDLKDKEKEIKTLGELLQRRQHEILQLFTINKFYCEYLIGYTG